MMVSILDAGLLGIDELLCLDPVATRFWFMHARDEQGRLKVSKAVLPGGKPSERAEKRLRELGARLRAQGLTGQQITEKFAGMLRAMIGQDKPKVVTKPRGRKKG